jgi:hypothetical protein
MSPNTAMRDGITVRIPTSSVSHPVGKERND